MSRQANVPRSDALPTVELRYEALLDRTNDAVCLISLDGRFLKVNRRVEAILGYSADELEGREVRSTIVPREARQSRERHSSLSAGEKQPIFERTLVTRDGREVPVEIDAALVCDDTGRPLYIQSIVRDISDRKKEHEALRLIVEGTSSQTGTGFFQSLVQHLAAVLQMEHVLISERIDDRLDRVRTLAFWSDGRLLENMEYEPSGNMCESVLDGTLHCHEDSVQLVFPDVEDLRKLSAECYLGLPLLDTRSGSVIGHLTVMGKCKMRSRQRAESIVRIFAARAGAELGRLRTERELHDSEQRYRVLVERIPAITYIDSLSRTHHVSYISPQVEPLLGYPIESWTQNEGHWRRTIHPDDRARVIAEYERAQDTDHNFSAEYRLIAQDGHLVWVRDEAAGITDKDGGLLFLQGVIVDITHSKKLEEDLLNTRKLESVGLLAGGIAHDFNNLLMGIVGSLSLAKRETASDQPAYRRLHEAEKVAQRAAALARQLLSFSKGGAPVRRPTELAGQIRDTVQFTLAGSNVQADFDVTDAMWPVDADEGQISQVIENMIINAKQAMPGGGRVWITTRNVDTGRDEVASLSETPHIRIDIRDEGVGIDARDLGRIFDPYFTLKENGNGLGLAMCHAVISKHDGRILVESEPGVGTTFSLYLPASGGPVAESPSPRAQRPAFEGHILVMDDETTVRGVVSEMLEHLGATGRFARNGSAAIELYRRARDNGHPFDAVILDLTVPGAMGGKEAIERLLEIDPRARVIVSSGYSDDPVMSEYARHGFVGCLAKPYDVQDLRDALWSATEAAAAES